MDFKELVRLYLREARVKFGFAPDAENFDLPARAKYKNSKYKKPKESGTRFYDRKSKFVAILPFPKSKET